MQQHSTFVSFRGVVEDNSKAVSTTCSMYVFKKKMRSHPVMSVLRQRFAAQYAASQI
jgi:hypothetical protein